jgi:hypothetical protein
MQADGLQVVHLIPGRLRVRIPASKHTPELGDQIRERLAEVEGIQHVETRTATGSVLVLYDVEAVDSPDFLESLINAFCACLPGSVDLPDLQSWQTQRGNGTIPPRPLANRITEFFSELDAKVEHQVGPGANLKSLFPAGLFVLGLGKLLLARQAPLPRWYDLMWYSFNSFLALNPTGVGQHASAPGGQQSNGSSDGANQTG